MLFIGWKHPQKIFYSILKTKSVVLGDGENDARAAGRAALRLRGLGGGRGALSGGWGTVTGALATLFATAAALNIERWRWAGLQACVKEFGLLHSKEQQWLFLSINKG